MPIIEVRNLSKTFVTKDATVQALKEINFEVEEGDIYGIIGMSGAGKSTLVRCLNYLEVPTQGTVIVEGHDLSKLSGAELRSLRSSIGMIFQGFNLLMQSKVIDNVMFPLLIHKVTKAEAKKKAEQLLDTVGLSDKAQAYPAQLSGGQRQRVAIARALAMDPKILLCDEATSALDPQTTQSILQLLKKINRETGITIVIITHQMSVVREICHNVAIVQSGEIVERGLVEDIFTHPQSRAAKQLVIEGKDPDEFAKEQEAKSKAVPILHESRKIRIVFGTQSSFEPVIANMILTVGVPVNILRASTMDVGGTARGDMILGLPADPASQEKIISYLKERGLAVEEVQ
ncbi:MAG: ATP-binding cassette domain-containing protein [Lachnospiraceae bacterium]|jgi:D-methionine transport system ATP-binding protein|nr:ATP-binding cassette domain-containing protein [Lachnospiraceae bacterium]MCI1399073.1 ATP-binding cassette domain-containing protein [Lachnospiraceae bacterium]MCI1423785.1 ATP-binding cassette domain-containing protein [Lachnospiraceae bacterium]MCI1452569.1 ATP-binding cassette domain-containing protein [Lachnospiraceae bacterium]MDD5849424.1 ATP-binding cassette domain-containing protein [Bacillota bacterium]